MAEARNLGSRWLVSDTTGNGYENPRTPEAVLHIGIYFVFATKGELP
jgi:hypothetical protein